MRNNKQTRVVDVPRIPMLVEHRGLSLLEGCCSCKDWIDNYLALPIYVAEKVFLALRDGH
jgi:hypothetical protein